jgi:hypothetical protein
LKNNAFNASDASNQMPARKFAIVFKLMMIGTHGEKVVFESQ